MRIINFVAGYLMPLQKQSNTHFLHILTVAWLIYVVCFCSHYGRSQISYLTDLKSV
jgi:uncharacterized membrane protein YdcZ (DUF606 family)